MGTQRTKIISVFKTFKGEMETIIGNHHGVLQPGGRRTNGFHFHYGGARDDVLFYRHPSGSLIIASVRMATVSLT